MSPEQVRGRPVDHRSDIFSFGSILYEMLTGGRAFRGDSAVETMNAILKEDPPELSESSHDIPAALQRVVRHCLEKNPEERFQSARDLAFDLQALFTHSLRGAQSIPIWTALTKRRLLRLSLGISLLAAVALGSFFAGKRAGEKPVPSFHRLTFRRGFIHAARFAPDGRTIIYGAAWDGNRPQLFSMQPESPESRALGLPNTDLLSVSSSGELAVSLDNHWVMPFIYIGTLARVPLAGAAPRQVLEDVQWADWSPDAANLAIVRDVQGRDRLEFPAGNVLYETTGWIGDPRISPKGDLIAFLDHPVRNDNAGSVAVVDLNGKKRTLSSGWVSEMGLAWFSNGDEVWFTGTRTGLSRAIYAVMPSGKERLVTRMVGGLTLQDISPDGRVLVTSDNLRLAINCLPPGETKERDLSWLDWSVVRDLSDDGKTLLIGEAGEGGGARHASYLRKTDGSPAVRLSEGSARSLSPDGKWVITTDLHSSPTQLIMMPVGAGESKPLTNDAIRHERAKWFPDGKRFVFQGIEPGHKVRLYVQDLAGGSPRAITPEGVFSYGNPISPDGKFVVGIDSDQKVWVYPVEGGEPRPVPGLDIGDAPLRWHADSRSLYVYRRGDLPAKVYRVDVSNGRKEFWKEFLPPDPAGIEVIDVGALTPDGKSYAYSYSRNLSELYLIEGLK
jgi:Tol biopolymer transport system component